MSSLCYYWWQVQAVSAGDTVILISYTDLTLAHHSTRGKHWHSATSAHHIHVGETGQTQTRTPRYMVLPVLTTAVTCVESDFVERGYDVANLHGADPVAASS